jgi:cytoskeletal protein CcmA (bactofilin family)
MLEGFRKRDVSHPRTPSTESPYSQLHSALSPATPADAAKPEAAKPGGQKAQEPAKSAPSADKLVSKLTVGADIKLKGVEITDCDTLVVEGRVEASMDSRVIQIAESGIFVGKVGIDVAEIHGRFEGDLVAHRRLVIHASAHVSGKIRYGTISIEEGGQLSGDIAAISSTRTIPKDIAADQKRAPEPNATTAASFRPQTGDSRTGAATNR